jgi:type II secretory pathway component PulL
MKTTIIINEPMNELVEIDEEGHSNVVGNLFDLAKVSAEQQCIFVLLIDSKFCVSHTVDLPQVKAKDLASIIPYTLEDMLIKDISTQRFSFCKTDNPGEYAVLVCDIELINSKVDHYLALGVELESILPLSLALRLHSDHWAVLCDDFGYHVRTGHYDQLYFDESCIDDVLTGLLNRSDTLPNVIDIINGNDEKCSFWERSHWGLENLSLDAAYDLESILSCSVNLNLLPSKKKNNFSNFSLGGFSKSSWMYLIVPLVVAIFVIPIVSWGFLWHRSHVKQDQLSDLYQHVFHTTDKNNIQLDKQSKELSQAISDMKIFDVLNKVAITNDMFSGVTLKTIDYKNRNILLLLEFSSMADIKKWSDEIHKNNIVFTQDAKKQTDDSLLLTVTIKGV